MEPRETSDGGPTGGGLNRRTFLYGAAGVGVAAATGASIFLQSAQAAASGKKHLNYWNLFGGGDGVRMLQMEHDFTTHYPDVYLNAVTLAWGVPYYTKLSMATVGGHPPDVAISHMSRLPGFAPAGILTALDTQTLARYGITSDKFLPRVWNKAHYDGKLYAVPLDTHPFVMYYNTEVCKKAGLLDANGRLKPLVGPHAIVDAFKRAQKVTGRWGLSVDSQDVTPWRLFYALYKQTGGTVLGQNGTRLTLDNAKALKVLSFMRDLTLESKVAAHASRADLHQLHAQG